MTGRPMTIALDGDIGPRLPGRRARKRVDTLRAARSLRFARGSGVAHRRQRLKRGRVRDELVRLRTDAGIVDAHLVLAGRNGERACGAKGGHRARRTGAALTALAVAKEGADEWRGGRNFHSATHTSPGEWGEIVAHDGSPRKP